jgi:hypothetical protein
MRFSKYIVSAIAKFLLLNSSCWLEFWEMLNIGTYLVGNGTSRNSVRAVDKLTIFLTEILCHCTTVPPRLYRTLVNSHSDP